MLFLIEYNRPNGQIIQLVKFDDSERSKAESSRLKVELELSRRKIDHEVVLLEAASEKALRRTHRRYFEDATQIAATATGNQKW